MPRNLWNSFLLVGNGISSMALIFVGSASTPRSEIKCPKKVTSVFSNWHFDRFNFKPCFRMEVKTNYNLVCSRSCSGVSAQMIMLS